jgi:hypothetical protein
MAKNCDGEEKKRSIDEAKPWPGGQDPSRIKHEAKKDRSTLVASCDRA